MVVNEADEALPSWNFHSGGDSDNRQGSASTSCRVLWKTELGTRVIPVGYGYTQYLIPTHSSIAYSPCPPAPLNFSRDFSVFPPVPTQFPLTTYATVYFCLWVLCILHHPFQIPPPPRTFSVLPVGVSYSFHMPQGWALDLAPSIYLTLPDYWIRLFVYIGYLFPFSTGLSAAYFLPLLLVSLACINSTGPVLPDLLFYNLLSRLRILNLLFYPFLSSWLHPCVWGNNWENLLTEWSFWKANLKISLPHLTSVNGPTTKIYNYVLGGFGEKKAGKKKSVNDSHSEDKIQIVWRGTHMPFHKLDVLKPPASSLTLCLSPRSQQYPPARQ